MNAPSPLFEIAGLEHVYGGATVLDIPSLTIASGAITGLVGPNGSGKSTLLRLLGGIEGPTRGRITCNGAIVKPFCEAVRFQITLLPQEPFLMKRSVFKNVSYGLKLRGEKEAVAERVREALTFVGLDAGRFAARPWYALSGGEAQRVALAARLALKPKVLLLDEPTASVDVTSAQLIREASLRAREEWGTTILVASHDRQWLYDVCDDLLHLFRGKVLGRRHETIVLGPWIPLPDGQYARRLGPGTHLMVPRPPHAEAAALIPFSPLGQDGKNADKSGPICCIRGAIRRISLERSTGKLIVTLMAGDLAFDVVLAGEDTPGGGLLPGTPFDACYRIDDIQWI